MVFGIIYLILTIYHLYIPLQSIDHMVVMELSLDVLRINLSLTRFPNFGNVSQDLEMELGFSELLVQVNLHAFDA